MVSDPIFYSEAELIKLFKKFYSEIYQEEISQFLKNYPNSKSLIIDIADIEIFDENLAFNLLMIPEKVLESAEEALKEYLEGFSAITPEIENDLRLDEFKPNIRVKNLPAPYRKRIKDIKSEQIGRLVEFKALIRRASFVKPSIYKVEFKCPKCGAKITDIIKSKYEFRRQFPKCANCKIRMEPIIESARLIDVQKLIVQELPEEIEGGEEPYTIEVWLTDDIVGTVKPGDTVSIVGIPKVTIESPDSPVLKTYIESVYIEKRTKIFEEIKFTDEDIKEIEKLSKDPDIEEKIINSIAPSIYLPGELSNIKLALALQLFGGVRRKLPDGTNKRGEIHILLFGEPGVAKSSMLRYIKELAPKAIHVVSKTSTVAGLTAVAVKDRFFGWTIEAGAMVLADGGIILVDELDKFEKTELHGLLEAMEQGTVSIAKAGIVTVLNARTSVLAAANPREGRFTGDKLPIEIIAKTIPSQLISRFDLIFILKDVLDPNFDEKMAEHITKSYYSPEEVKPEIPLELLRKYIAYARKEINPVLSKEARDKIVSYYVEKRKEMQGMDYITISKRQLEAIIRLAEAHARMRLSNIIEVKDIETAIRLMDFSLKQVAQTEEGTIDVSVLEIGTSLNKRRKMELILEIIEGLEEEFPDGVPYNEIKEKALAKGLIKEEEFDKLLEQLHENGDIYSTGVKKYRLTRK